MNCEQIGEEIIAQPVRLAPEVVNHLRSCPACSRMQMEQESLWRDMAAWEAPDVSPDFNRRLFARIGHHQTASSRAGLDWLFQLFRPLRPAFPAALACMLLVATLVMEHGNNTPAPPPETATATSIDDVKQIDTALDDFQMLNEFEILPLGESGEGKS